MAYGNRPSQELQEGGHRDEQVALGIDYDSQKKVEIALAAGRSSASNKRAENGVAWGR